MCSIIISCHNTEEESLTGISRKKVRNKSPIIANTHLRPSVKWRENIQCVDQSKEQRLRWSNSNILWKKCTISHSAEGRVVTE